MLDIIESISEFCDIKTYTILKSLNRELRMNLKDVGERILSTYNKYYPIYSFYLLCRYQKYNPRFFMHMRQYIPIDYHQRHLAIFQDKIANHLFYAACVAKNEWIAKYILITNKVTFHIEVGDQCILMQIFDSLLRSKKHSILCNIMNYVIKFRHLFSEYPAIFSKNMISKLISYTKDEKMLLNLKKLLKLPKIELYSDVTYMKYFFDYTPMKSHQTTSLNWKYCMDFQKYFSGL